MGIFRDIFILTTGIKIQSPVKKVKRKQSLQKKVANKALCRKQAKKNSNKKGRKGKRKTLF